jgi:predicted dehydrogenase
VVQTFHLPVIRHLMQSGALSVSGCFDRNVEAAVRTAQALGASRAGGPSDMGDLQSTDAVLIATPPEYHAPLAEYYLTRGKDTFVEKPFVVSRAEAQRLVELAEQHRARLFVNHFRPVLRGSFYCQAVYRQRQPRPGPPCGGR